MRLSPHCVYMHIRTCKCACIRGHVCVGEGVRVRGRVGV